MRIKITKLIKQIPMDELTHTGIDESKNNKSLVKLSVFKSTSMIYEAFE